MIKQVQLAINSFGFEIGSKTFQKKQITDFFIDRDGVIREKNPLCANCDSALVIMNGYTIYHNKLFDALGLEIKKGQCICLCCGCHYVVDLPQFTEMNKDFKEALKSLTISLRLRGLYYEDISEVAHEVFGYKVCSEKMRDIFNETEESVKDLMIYFKQSGYYAYDVQRFTIKGRRHCRHVVHDLITGRVLFDKVLPDECKQTIIYLFKKYIDAGAVRGFVVDMAPPYPRIIKECFGNDVKIQWCLFHLFQDIRRKYKECKKETDNSGFQNELNKQTIFDFAYPRSELIEYLNKVLKWLKLIEEKIKQFDEKKKRYILKTARKNFWRQYRQLQKNRKKTCKKRRI